MTEDDQQDLTVAYMAGFREGQKVERERVAAWHDKQAKHWNSELWERRSWGGPTMGAEECIAKEAAHKEAAAAIRKETP